MVAYMRGEANERCNSAPSPKKEGRINMYNDHCCKGCDKRQVGCRSDCEAWAQHEAEKAKYYSERSIMNNAHYVSRSL